MNHESKFTWTRMIPHMTSDEVRKGLFQLRFLLTEVGIVNGSVVVSDIQIEGAVEAVALLLRVVFAPCECSRYAVQVVGFQPHQFRYCKGR